MLPFDGDGKDGDFFCIDAETLGDPPGDGYERDRGMAGGYRVESGGEAFEFRDEV